ncbi:MAG: class I SAM-dependent methyltransferase [Dehalococcoidia bacterium]|nr:class I SAM-dependent methyltransferase [Dehalococcoidia bacterium]
MKRDKRFDWLAPVYDWGMVLVERALSSHRRGLLERAGGLVLEIGVGTGATLHYYPSGCRVVGIDTSPAMLRRATLKAAQLELAFTPLIMNAQQLAFPDGYFDTVVSSFVLCSVADPKQTLCEIRRVLRPDGKALFLEHVRPSGALGVMFDVFNLVWSPVVCQLTRRTETLVNWAGFDLIFRQAPVDFLRVMEAVPHPGRGGCVGRTEST